MSTKQQSTVTKYLSVHTLPPDVCNCVCVCLLVGVSVYTR